MGVSVTMAGSIVLFVLLFVTTTLVGITLYTFTTISRDFFNQYLKTIQLYRSEIRIVNSTVKNITYTDSGVKLNIVVEILNLGHDPIWDFNHCDIFLLYMDNNTNTLQTTYLYYGVNWWVTGIKLTENYTVPFTQHKIIDSGETGIIEIVVEAPIDTSHPVKITFVTHYGSRASKWISLTG